MEARGYDTGMEGLFFRVNFRVNFLALVSQLGLGSFMAGMLDLED